MQMKLEEEKLAAASQPGGKKLKREASNSVLMDLQLQNQAYQSHSQLPQSSLSSTLKSLDPPPKEYENQLQLYEFEVRNHIKAE